MYAGQRAFIREFPLTMTPIGLNMLATNPDHQLRNTFTLGNRYSRRVEGPSMLSGRFAGRTCSVPKRWLRGRRDFRYGFVEWGGQGLQSPLCDDQASKGYLTHVQIVCFSTNPIEYSRTRPDVRQSVVVTYMKAVGQWQEIWQARIQYRSMSSSQ